jgi:hypothetical protein
MSLEPVAIADQDSIIAVTELLRIRWMNKLDLVALSPGTGYLSRVIAAVRELLPIG